MKYLVLSILLLSIMQIHSDPSSTPPPYGQPAETVLHGQPIATAPSVDEVNKNNQKDTPGNKSFKCCYFKMAGLECLLLGWEKTSSSSCSRETTESTHEKTA